MEHTTSEFNQQSQTPLRHSGIGIASFIISLVIFVFFILLFAGAGFIGVAASGQISETSPVIMMIGLLAIIGLVVCLIGIGLGIGGFFQKNRKRIFSILGLSFNALVFFGVVILIIIGNSMG